MKHKTQSTQLYLFQFSKYRFWAFTQMGRGIQLANVPGLRFFKLLGTGAGNGFSLRPDFSTYALLLVWEDEHSASQFSTHFFLNAYFEKAQTIRLLNLQSFASSGRWSGETPFVSTHEKVDKKKPVAIITRATLRWNRLLSFWKNVPRASKSIESAKGVNFFKGIGEWPFIQQATISLWDSLDDVIQFAYKDPIHSTIVKKTRKQQWYKEDLFARFTINSDLTLKS
jgi:hypothetical protein